MDELLEMKEGDQLTIALPEGPTLSVFVKDHQLFLVNEAVTTPLGTLRVGRKGEAPFESEASTILKADVKEFLSAGYIALQKDLQRKVKDVSFEAMEIHEGILWAYFFTNAYGRIIDKEPVSQLLALVENGEPKNQIARLSAENARLRECLTDLDTLQRGMEENARDSVELLESLPESDEARGAVDVLAKTFQNATRWLSNFKAHLSDVDRDPFAAYQKDFEAKCRQLREAEAEVERQRATLERLRELALKWDAGTPVTPQMFIGELNGHKE
jgi:hypothetical protein